MADPEWYTKALAEGRILSETGVKPIGVDSVAPTGDRGPETKYGTGIGKLSEAEFQGRVIDLAKALGWRVAHFRKVHVHRDSGQHFWETPVAADGKGFLDLELVRERLVKIELKVGYNKPTPEQELWIAAYKRAGVEVYAFYPEDWSELERVLA